MEWLLLALIAPLLWAVVALIDDNLLRGLYRSPVLAALVSGICGMAPMLSLVWLNIQPTTVAVVSLAGLAGLLTVVYYYFYFQALEYDAPSVVISLFSLAPVALPFFAHFLVGENLKIMQIIGFAIVLFFTFMLAAVDVKKFRFSKALLSISIAAILLDGVLLSEKYVYQHVNFYSGFMFFSLGMGVGGLLLVILMILRNFNKPFHFKKSKGLRFIVTALIFVAITEVINIAAEFTSNLAVSKGPVSLVEVIQNIQPLYMLTLALLLYPFFPKYFREARYGRVRFKFLMMAGIMVGVALTVVGKI